MIFGHTNIKVEKILNLKISDSFSEIKKQIATVEVALRLLENEESRLVKRAEDRDLEDADIQLVSLNGKQFQLIAEDIDRMVKIYTAMAIIADEKIWFMNRVSSNPKIFSRLKIWAVEISGTIPQEVIVPDESLPTEERMEKYFTTEISPTEEKFDGTLFQEVYNHFAPKYIPVDVDGSGHNWILTYECTENEARKMIRDIEKTFETEKFAGLMRVCRIPIQAFHWSTKGLNTDDELDYYLSNNPIDLTLEEILYRMQKESEIPYDDRPDNQKPE